MLTAARLALRPAPLRGPCATDMAPFLVETQPAPLSEHLLRQCRRRLQVAGCASSCSSCRRSLPPSRKTGTTSYGRQPGSRGIAVLGRLQIELFLRLQCGGVLEQSTGHFRNKQASRHTTTCHLNLEGVGSDRSCSVVGTQASTSGRISWSKHRELCSALSTVFFLQLVMMVLL